MRRAVVATALALPFAALSAPFASTPQASATPTLSYSNRDIRYMQEYRAVFHLSSDYEYARAAASGTSPFQIFPDAVGIPMTTLEHGQVVAQIAFNKKAANLATSASSIPSFAGLWLDPDHANMLHVALAPNTGSAQQDVLAASSLPASAVVFHDAVYPLPVLTSQAEALLVRWPVITFVAPDVEHNRLHVELRAADMHLAGDVAASAQVPVTVSEGEFSPNAATDWSAVAVDAAVVHDYMTYAADVSPVRALATSLLPGSAELLDFFDGVAAGTIGPDPTPYLPELLDDARAIVDFVNNSGLAPVTPDYPGCPPSVSDEDGCSPTVVLGPAEQMLVELGALGALLLPDDSIVPRGSSDPDPQRETEPLPLKAGVVIEYAKYDKGRIVALVQCTAGFGGYHNGPYNFPPYYVDVSYGQFTNGHCGPDNQLWQHNRNYIGRGRSSSFYENPDQDIWTDAQVIVQQTKQTTNLVYLNAGRYQDIKYSRNSGYVLNEQLCKSLAFSGTGCGKVMATGVRLYGGCLEDGACVQYVTNLVRTSMTSKAGDSGGPIFLNQTAYGLNVGHDDHDYEYFTPISNVTSYTDYKVLVVP